MMQRKDSSNIREQEEGLQRRPATTAGETELVMMKRNDGGGRDDDDDEEEKQGKSNGNGSGRKNNYDRQQSDAGSVASSSALSLTASAMDRDKCRKVFLSMSGFLLLWLFLVVAAHQIRFPSEIPDGAPGSGDLNNKNMHQLPTEGKGTTSGTTTAAAAGGTTAGNDDSSGHHNHEESSTTKMAKNDEDDEGKDNMMMDNMDDNMMDGNMMDGKNTNNMMDGSMMDDHNNMMKNKKKNLDTKRYVMELATLKPVYINATTRTTGTVIIETNSSWAPIGAQHFHELVTQNQFYDGCKFFRVVPNFMVQFGLNGDPALQSRIEKTVLQDDPVAVSNKRGRITYASSGPHTRTTQLFINYDDNHFLDSKGFSPFGTVDTNGMKYIDHINDRYGEKPDQNQIHERGNEYLDKEFPYLSYIVSIREET